MNDDRRSLERTTAPNPAVRSQWKWKNVPHKSRRFRVGAACPQMKAGLLEWMFIARQIPLPIESVLVNAHDNEIRSGTPKQ